MGEIFLLLTENNRDDNFQSYFFLWKNILKGHAQKNKGTKKNKDKSFLKQNQPSHTITITIITPIESLNNYCITS